MDIWQAIRDDHERVDVLFEKIAESDDQAALIAELRAELEAHAQGEEKAVYPELAKLDALKDMIGNAREDHEEMREISGQVRDRRRGRADGPGRRPRGGGA